MKKKKQNKKKSVAVWRCVDVCVWGCLMYYGCLVINSSQNGRLDTPSTYRILERKAEERDYVLPFIVLTGAAHGYKRKDGSYIKI